MSWLKGLFGKTPAPANAGKQASAPTANAANDNNREAAAEAAENTLARLLDSSAAPAPQQAYDPVRPPAIEPERLNRLRCLVRDIPPMPEIWHQVQEILQQPGASATDLGLCVEQDPVLTARILTVCNSPAYKTHGSAEITNIRLAIARLGLNEASIIIFSSLAPDLGDSVYKKREIRHVWFHSQAVAALARILAEPGERLSRDQASLAAMLHDIGKLVMLHIESEARLLCLMERIDQGMPTLAAEFDEFGYTHIDAGMMLALHWKLPKYVQHMIARHHHPETAAIDTLPENERHLMATLQLAHLVLQHVMDGAGHRDNLSIWHAARRSCGGDIAPFTRDELALPLESTAMYEQFQREIERLQRAFADLFQSSDPLHGSEGSAPGVT